MLDYPVAEHYMFTWEAMEVMEADHSFGESVSYVEWLERYHRLTLAKRLRSVTISNTASINQRDSLLVALVINKSFGHALPVHFQYDRQDDDQGGRKSSDWVSRVRNARLYIIETERKDQPRGYRLVGSGMEHCRSIELVASLRGSSGRADLSAARRWMVALSLIHFDRMREWEGWGRKV